MRSGRTQTLDGAIQHGRVFDRTTKRDEIAAGCQAMADGEAVKVLIRP
jgi:threonine dehydrogenase-like Zn-dependent dehydrogenase